jgi:hypothetical protein
MQTTGRGRGPLRWWCRAVVVAMVAVVSLLASGCTAATSGGEDQPEPKGMPALRADTREPAALQTLRRLDACVLLDEAAAAKVGRGRVSQMWREAPHACTANANGVKIDMTFDALTRGERYQAKPIVIAGHKAYQDSETGGTASCTLTAPVSFDLALQYHATWITALSQPNDPCTRLAPLVPAGLARLPRAMSTPVDPASAPGSEWDACTLLKAAQPAETTLSFGATEISPYLVTLDGCSAATRPSADAQRTVEFASMYDTMYGVLPSTSAASAQIDNHPVQVNSDSLGCTITWSDGPANATVLRSVRDADCGHATQTTSRILAALRTAPPARTGPVAPLVFFAPDEPDEPIVGACVDWPHDGCQNYVPPTDPPGSGQALLTAADRDPNVVCLASADAVRALFGPKLRPVVFGDFCHFLSPDHTADIQIAFTSKYAPNMYLTAPDDHRTPVTIAGHPALAAHHNRDILSTREYQIYASPGQDTAKPGYISVDLQLMTPRGIGGVSDHAPIDSTRSNLVVPLVDALLRRYFNPTS